MIFVTNFDFKFGILVLEGKSIFIPNTINCHFRFQILTLEIDQTGKNSKLVNTLHWPGCGKFQLVQLLWSRVGSI